MLSIHQQEYEHHFCIVYAHVYKQLISKTLHATTTISFTHAGVREWSPFLKDFLCLNCESLKNLAHGFSRMLMNSFGQALCKRDFRKNVEHSYMPLEHAFESLQKHGNEIRAELCFALRCLRP